MADETETTLRELADGLGFPEGPVCLPNGDIVVCELRAGRVSVVKGDGSGGRRTLAEPGGSPNGAAIGPDGRLYVCNSGGWRWTDLGSLTIPGDHQGTQADDYSGGRIERIDLDTGAVDVLYTECDGLPLKAPNDLVFAGGPDGGFWFTDHGHMRARDRDRGTVYWAKADGSEIREVIHPLDSPNGIGLSPDGTRLYVAETHTGRVFWWALDPATPGTLAAPNPLPFGHGGTLLHGAPGNQLFDSLAIDGEGYVCVATIGNGGITVVSPDGQSVQHAALPDAVVTNICFRERTAYVTLSSTGKLVAFEWPRWRKAE